MSFDFTGYAIRHAQYFGRYETGWHLYKVTFKEGRLCAETIINPEDPLRFDTGKAARLYAMNHFAVDPQTGLMYLPDLPHDVVRCPECGNKEMAYVDKRVEIVEVEEMPNKDEDTVIQGNLIGDCSDSDPDWDGFFFCRNKECRAKFANTFPLKFIGFVPEFMGGLI